MFDDELQFYPTPKALAKRAWGKFQNTDFTRVLEPSAGKGDLAMAYPVESFGRRHVDVDCIELNVELHGALKENNLKVVGTDFLEYDGPGAIYSHIIMNPPFKAGAEHVLKAWNILYDGEIVAILNAETIRNPYSKERKFLVSLIEKHGEVEYIADAFKDAERPTDVEVALVYLRKESNFNSDLAGSILDDLRKDQVRVDDLAKGFHNPNELAVPATFVENAVLVFNAAVRAAKEAVFADARKQYYTRLIGETMAKMSGQAPDPYLSYENLQDRVRMELGKAYDDLKDRAWTGILRSSQVLDMLSSAAQNRLESDFDRVKKLEFTAKNIYGFLLGLSKAQGDIQIQMLCDIFDTIVRYHTDNAHFYMGWKSNDKHRLGMKIRTTRFIIPGHRVESYMKSPNYQTLQLLHDMDKVFALLDGKDRPEISLVNTFRSNFDALRRGARLETSYFDVRFYPGTGTIHFFPTDKKLISRLNLMVGRQRMWLPQEHQKASKDFWKQYDKADTLSKDFGAMATHSEFHALLYRPGSEGDMAEESLCKKMAKTLEKHGIDPVAMLKAPEEEAPQAALPLLKAAG